MKRTVIIKLRSSTVGTRAIVTEKLSLGEEISYEYLCYRCDPIMGGEWKNETTRVLATDEINKLLNDSARAASQLHLYNTARMTGS
ncbi:hypothetical protein [Nitrosomonas communis]|uniref:Uncharacterized protein n=1 Tax=Nitrosomonas communis TaxID=44574 RepID=A0A1I4Q7G1_9PROT|nr:hypothetical protein [Nitrosomonas communis]SFM35987.1 hypothetical protein SAMN05421863_102517 [Nitrosomonas communis]